MLLEQLLLPLAVPSARLAPTAPSLTSPPPASPARVWGASRLRPAHPLAPTARLQQCPMPTPLPAFLAAVRTASRDTTRCRNHTRVPVRSRTSTYMRCEVQHLTLNQHIFSPMTKKYGVSPMSFCMQAASPPSPIPPHSRSRQARPAAPPQAFRCKVPSRPSWQASQGCSPQRLRSPAAM